MTPTQVRFAVLMTLATLPLLAVPAFSDEKGWFIGAAQGEADYHVQVSDFDDGSIVSGATDSHELGWKLWGGYRFNRWLSLEVGYIELQNDFDEPIFQGVSNGGGTLFESLPDGPVSVGYSPRGVFVEAVGSVPLGGRLYAFGKLGVLSWENETRIQDLDGVTRRDDSGTDPVLGAGVEYRFKLGLALRAEYEVFQDILGEDIDLTTAGISYRF